MGSEAKFKVGDRVRHMEDGWTATITALFGGDSAEVSIDGKGGTNGELLANLIPIKAPVVIREGCYYKTRDGRKVGPAKLCDNGRYNSYYTLCTWVVDGVLYQDNGTFADGTTPEHDLIAEWSDEHTHTSNPAAEVDNLRDEYGPVGVNDNSTAAKFKVGDRVATDGGYTFDPSVGTVKEVGTSCLSVKVDGQYGEWNYFDNELRLVAPTTSGNDDDEPDTKLLVSISADTSALDAEIDRVLKRLRKLKRKARKLGISLEYSELRDAA
ncbi:hypothetical protein [Aquamicrobium soli]|uniref:Uncharacterized protein n=1 Tax=Aquamicrobium soli TaxID=1811518 RepID=A0ABV7KAJ9_9HYPH